MRAAATAPVRVSTLQQVVRKGVQLCEFVADRVMWFTGALPQCGVELAAGGRMFSRDPKGQLTGVCRRLGLQVNDAELVPAMSIMVGVDTKFVLRFKFVFLNFFGILHADD